MWFCSIKVVAQFFGVSLPGLFRAERPGFEPHSDHYCQYIVPHTVSVLSLIPSVSCPHSSGGDGISQKGLATQNKLSHPISWVLNHFLQVIRTSFNGHQNHALLFMWCSIQILYQVLYLDKALTVLLVPWERTRSSSVLQHEEDGRWHQILTVSWFSCKSMIECPSRRIVWTRDFASLDPPLDRAAASPLPALIQCWIPFIHSNQSRVTFRSCSSADVSTSVGVARRALESGPLFKLTLN